MKYQPAGTYSGMVPIDELAPHPKNANRHGKEQIRRLADLIRYQGMRHPIVVSNRSGFIVAGHGRLEALKLLGATQAPVDYQDFESDEQEIAFLHSDNAIALWAELDLSSINAQLEDLGPDFDLEMLGIEDFNLDPPSFEEPAPKGEPSEKESELIKCPNCGVMVG